MGMPRTAERWTADMVRALPDDGNRYEVVDGQLLVTPAPSSARADRQAKRRLYQEEGVPEYWIVDLDARVVERWRPGDERPEIVAATLTWQPDPSTAPLQLDVGVLFYEVLGEP